MAGHGFETSNRMRFFLAAVFLFAPRVATAGQQKRTEELGDWGRPRILFQDSQRKMHHRWKCLAFANDGKTLAGSAVSKTGAMVLLQQSNGVVYSFDLSAVHPTPRRIADAWNQDVEVVKTPTGACPDPLMLVRWVYHKPQEAVVYTITDDKLDENSLQRIPISLPEHYRWNTLQIKSPAIVASADTLVFGTHFYEYEDRVKLSGKVVAWDLENRKARFTDVWPEGSVDTVACSADGRWIAAGGTRYAGTAQANQSVHRGRIVCWHKDFKSEYFDLRLDEDARCLAFTPDSKTLLAGQADGAIIWVDMEKKAIVKSVEIVPFSGKVSGLAECVAPSPDGRALAVGAGSWEIGYKWGQTFLVDVASGTVHPLRDSKEEHVVTCIAFSPDGKSLVAGSASGVLKLWQHDADGSQSAGQAMPNVEQR